MSATITPNTTTTATPGYAQYCSNRLPCGICKLMQTACPLSVNSWGTTWKNPYEVTSVNFTKEGIDDRH